MVEGIIPNVPKLDVSCVRVPSPVQTLAFVGALAAVMWRCWHASWRQQASKGLQSGAQRCYCPRGRARRTNITFPVHSGEPSSSPPSLRYHVGLGVFEQCFALFSPFSISRLSHLDGIFRKFAGVIRRISGQA